MTFRLSIQEIRPDGKVELGRLDSTDVVIGREPGPSAKSITIRSDAVSREHGVFSTLRGHWLYKDLGSTNGSWLNGVPVKQGQWKIVRPGDVVQVADRAIQISGLEGSDDSTIPRMRSLIVFSRGNLIDEYPIPEQGRALAIGGTRADLRLDVDIQEHPSLVIERRGDRVCVFNIVKDVPIYVNDKELITLVNLVDRDEIRISHYVILLNDPPQPGMLGVPTDEVKIHQPPKRVPITASEMAASSQATSSWGAMGASSDATLSGMNRSTSRLVFGKNAMDEEDGVNNTVSLDRSSIESQLRGTDRAPSMRHSVEEQASPEVGYDMMAERIIAFIGWVLLMTFAILMLVWIFM